MRPSLIFIIPPSGWRLFSRLSLIHISSVEDTISILRGLKERYEVHHGVRIQDAALIAAAVLSDRYISDRFLPDKAIDGFDPSRHNMLDPFPL